MTEPPSPIGRYQGESVDVPGVVVAVLPEPGIAPLQREGPGHHAIFDGEEDLTSLDALFDQLGGEPLGPLIDACSPYPTGGGGEDVEDDVFLTGSRRPHDQITQGSILGRRARQVYSWPR